MLSVSEQQWCPTSVQVTVQQARGLRVKGKSGTNDAYAVMQVGKEKYQTSVVEKTVAPVWKEEAAFDLPPLLLQQHGGGGGRDTLHVHVLHRALVGPDKLLGQAVINLLQLSEDTTRNKTEWFKLLDKNGKADKDRGEVLVDIQFMRNNMTASMFDLSAAGKSRSRLGKIKDKVRGKKKESDATSNVVPSFTQVLTDSEEEGNGDGEEATSKGEKKKKNKMKSLFSPKSNLQKNMSQSMSVLPGKNSTLSGSQSSGINVESSEGKKKFKFLKHKRSGSSDSKDSSSSHQKHGAVEQSNLCINGSHVYCEEPPPRTSRIGSNFSLTSSGHGSMEDVPESSPPSVDSLRAVRQYSPWTEEEEEEVQNIKEDVSEREEEEKVRMEEERGIKEEERVRRQEEEVKQLAEQKRRQEEERLWREEEERRRQEEEEKIRREEERKRLAEEKRRQEEEEKVKKEEEERAEEVRRRQEEEEGMRRQEEERKLAEEKKRLEEEERRVEEEKVRKKGEERIKREEERRRQEEEEKLRREEERKRLAEEKRRQEEEEKVRKEEEERAEEVRRRQEEEERMRRQEEECKLAEEKRRLEEEERRVEEEKVRQEKEERIKREEERRRQEEEEMVRRQKEREEKRRLEEQVRKQREEEERIRMEEERAEEERRRQEEERKLEEKRRLEEERRFEEERVKEEERIKREEEMAEEEMRRQEQEEREEKRRIEELGRRRREEEERIKKKKEEEEKARREKEEYERLVEDKRKREEEERRRCEEEEKARHEEEERIRVEEERRKEEEEERVRRQLAEEKRKLEEEERRQIEEEERKQREEMIREEERARKEAEEKMRQQDQERIRIEEEEKSKQKEEERMKREEKAEMERKEEEARKLEKEKLKREAEEQKKKEIKLKAAEKKSKVESEVPSTNPFDENYSSNPFEETPDSPAGPDSSSSKVSTVQQRVQPAASSLGSQPVSTDEKVAVGTQREKRAAPQPPGRQDQDGSTPHLAQTDKRSKDKDVKTVSVPPQRSVQVIAPLSRSPNDAKNSQQSSATKDTSNVAKPGKRPAPSRPRSADEEETSSERKTTSSSGGSVSRECGSEAKPIVHGLNPFEDDEDEAQDDAATTSGSSGSVQCPPAVSQTKIKSSKPRAPPLPANKAITSSTQNTEGDHVTDKAGVTDNSACEPKSEALTPVHVQEAPLQESVQREREVEAGGKKEGPPVTTRRLQPVKPLNPLKETSVSVAQGEKDSKSAVIPQEKIKVNAAGLKGPYSQLTQEELISLVLKQETQLSERDQKIAQLEQYIDNLLVRVMEEKPSILMSLNSLKKAA